MCVLMSHLRIKIGVGMHETARGREKDACGSNKGRGGRRERCIRRDNEK